MADAPLPFGSELYAALREIEHGLGILGRFTYADVQALKASDREEVAALLRPCLSYADNQRVKTASARDVARLLCVSSPEQATTVDASLPFGARVYEELRRRGMGPTGHLDYSEVQELKAADREGTLRLLRTSLDYTAIQRLKHAEPAAFADFLHVRHMQMAAANNGGGSWPFWLFFMVMIP